MFLWELILISWIWGVEGSVKSSSLILPCLFCVLSHSLNNFLQANSKNPVFQTAVLQLCSKRLSSVMWWRVTKPRCGAGAGAAAWGRSRGLRPSGGSSCPPGRCWPGVPIRAHTSVESTGWFEQFALGKSPGCVSSFWDAFCGVILPCCVMVLLCDTSSQLLAWVVGLDDPH